MLAINFKKRNEFNNVQCFLSFFFCFVSVTQLKLRPTGRLNVQVRHFREGDGKALH